MKVTKLLRGADARENMLVEDMKTVWRSVVISRIMIFDNTLYGTP